MTTPNKSAVKRQINKITGTKEEIKKKAAEIVWDLLEQAAKQVVEAKRREDHYNGRFLEEQQRAAHFAKLSCERQDQLNKAQSMLRESIRVSTLFQVILEKIFDVGQPPSADQIEFAVEKSYGKRPPKGNKVGVDHGTDFKFRDNLASLMRQRDKIESGGLLTAAAVLHMNADDRAIVERLVRANRAEHLLGELFAMLCLPRNRETLRGPAGGDALEELLRIVDKWKEEYDRGKGKQRQGEVSDRGGDKGRSEGSS